MTGAAAWTGRYQIGCLCGFTAASCDAIRPPETIRAVMPELPEVETTRRQIAPILVGRRIEHVETTAESYFFLTPPQELCRSLEGKQVAALDRVGKYLVARFDCGSRLLLHLGMTGQLFSSEATSLRLLSATARASLPPEAQLRFEPDEHTHLQLTLDGPGPKIFFRDVRKFGKVQWLEPGERNARLDRLGTDALQVTGELLFLANRGRRAAIKAMLLDQSVCAGVFIGTFEPDFRKSFFRVSLFACGDFLSGPKAPVEGHQPIPVRAFH